MPTLPPELEAIIRELQQEIILARQETRELAKEKDKQIAKLTQQLEDSNNKLKESLSHVSDLTNTAQTTADNGVSLANQAQQTANDGVNKANNAQQTANDGVNLANDGINRANNAQQTANDGVNRANQAQQTANDGVNRANNAQQTIDGALVGKLAPPVAVGSHTLGQIKSLGNHAMVKLNVRKGDIVEVIMHGSARGQFYYDINCQPTQNAKKLTPASAGIIMTGEPWHTIAANGLFQATTDGTLAFTAKFFKHDVSGVLAVSNLQLVAKVLLNKSS